MSKTTLTLDADYFTVEVTEAFLKDFGESCKTIELSGFIKLFIKYNLEFIEDYKGVFDLIAHIMTVWKNPGEQTTLLEVSQNDSKCLFCNFGKTVKVYNWTYKHENAESPMDRVVYKTQVGFFFGYEGRRLIEFGVCNGYAK